MDKPAFRLLLLPPWRCVILASVQIGHLRIAGYFFELGVLRLRQDNHADSMAVSRRLIYMLTDTDLAPT